MVTDLLAASHRPLIERAYAACSALARAHYENFPVASLLVPGRMRPAIAAIYAFARRADDFADEPGIADERRLALLDDWGRRLHAAAAGESGQTASSTEDLIFVALADTIRTHRLPVSPFDDLLSAFRQDVLVKRYDTWDDLLDYCSRSANPVGRLVLGVAGYTDAVLYRASDAVCTALQLTNFWQDLARDWSIGRLYVPLADREAAGAAEADLDRRRVTAEWRVALETVIARTRALFAAGRPVCDGVGGRLKYELRLTWLGGNRILDRLEGLDFDVFRRRPTLTAADAAPLVWRAATWRAA